MTWDDLGRFVETITGKETLLDAFNITHQTTITEEESTDEKPDNVENLSSEEEICFTREVTQVIHETLHKKKRRQVHQSSSLDILL